MRTNEFYAEVNLVISTTINDYITQIRRISTNPHTHISVNEISFYPKLYVSELAVVVTVVLLSRSGARHSIYIAGDVYGN